MSRNDLREAIALCERADELLHAAYRILSDTDVPYVADMIGSAADVVEQVIDDILIKGEL